MRPPRPDIAVPPMPPGIEWIGAEPPSAIEKLTARGPVLVHFLCAGHAASVRTLPYLAAWQERYGEHGLRVLGVNSPRFAFSGDLGKLAAALGRLEVPFPVASDPEHSIWRAYGCEGWPSSFLWRQGGALGWFQFGEGEYAATEEEIRTLLSEGAEDEAHDEPVEPLRPADAPGAKVLPPSAEVFPGGNPQRPWRVPAGAEPLELAYEGAGAAVTVDGQGRIEAREDDGPPRVVEIGAPGVHELSTHPRHGTHRLDLRLSPGLELYAISFAPGVR